MATAAANASSNESSKIPLFYGDKTKDQISPESWLNRCDQAALVNSWTDAQKIGAAACALRGEAEDWFEIEIKRLTSPTWETFTERFRTYQGKHTTISYQGCRLWPQIFAAHKEPTITKHYLKLGRGMLEYEDTMQMIPADTIQLPEAVTSNATYQALPAAVRTAIITATAEQVKRDIMDKLSMSVFYGGLQQHLRDYLLQKEEYTNLREMKNAVAAFDASRDKMPVAAVDEEIDAIRRRNTRPSNPNARPGQPKNMTCWYCQKRGHSQQDCRKRARDKAPLVKGPPTKVNETSEDTGIQQVNMSAPLNY